MIGHVTHHTRAHIGVPLPPSCYTTTTTASCTQQARTHEDALSVEADFSMLLVLLLIQAMVSLSRAVIIAFGLGGEDQEIVAKILNMVLAGLASGTILLAARQMGAPGMRRAWTIIGLGAGANFVGDTLYLLVGLLTGETPFPSVADAAYLVYYPLIFAGLLTIPRPPETLSERLKFWLDALTTTVGGGLALWYFLIYPIAESQESTRLAALVGAAYPVADLVLMLAIATVTLRVTDALGRAPLALLGTAIGAFMVGDMAYGSLNVSGLYVAGKPITLLSEIPFQTSYLLLALAGYLAAREARTAQTGGDSDPEHAQPLSLLPYLGICLGYGLLLWVSFGDLSESVQGVIFGAVLLTALVVARQIVAVRENVRLIAAQATRRSEARFRSLVQHAFDVVTIVDGSGQIVYQSPSLERVLGYEPEAALGRQLLDLVHAEDRERGRLFLDSASRQDSVGVSIDWRVRHRDGVWRHVETVASNLLDDPDVAGLVLTSRDNTERHTLAEQLRHQAFHDTLTGLENRALFENRLAHALSRSARTARPVAILFLDLDNFKTVNDSLGHSAGDDVLVTVARRIRRIVREADTVARFGGDEFAILIEDMAPGEAPIDEPMRVAERLLEACRRPFMVQDHEVFIGCSIGIAVSDSGVETADELLRNADVAMYLGKEHGKGRCEIFESQMHSRILERLELESDLRLAIERREFVVYYQPIVSLESNRITGVEALVRWNHPTRGFLPPGVFIPRAEETGLIVPLGYQVLRQACQDARAWQEKFPASPPLTVTVNLSVRQLEHPGCVSEVREALDESGVPPASLVLEITESFMIDDPEAAIARLSQLKQLGVQIALDDFGTGFSSLSYLQRLPVDVLKIDRAFIEQMVETGRDASLVDAILTLGRSLQLKTVAEGIERADQLSQLRDLGCTFGQGYLLSRPREHAVIDALLAEQQAEIASEGETARTGQVGAGVR